MKYLLMIVWFHSSPVLGWSRDSLEREATKVATSLAKKHGLPMPLFAQLVQSVVEVESGYNPLAISPAGAVGLMQLTPPAAQEAQHYCKLRPLGTGNEAVTLLQDPVTNLWYGSCFLVFLMRVALPTLGVEVGMQPLRPEILIWYNGGGAQVKRWLAGKPLHTQTAHYLVAVLAQVEKRQALERWRHIP